MCHKPFSLFYHNALILLGYFPGMIHCNSLEASIRVEHFCALKQHNLGRRFGTSEMHLSPQVA